MTERKKDKTAAIQKSLETRVKFPISYFDSRKYIQHNVLLGDGLGPILEFMDSLPVDRTKVTVTHRFEDADHSFALADYELGDWGRMVGFEVHRWEDDRIVEHWDNLQATPAAPNPSGRSMTDGGSEAEDLGHTDVNKQLAERFVQEALIGGRRELSFVSERLIQHHPAFGDGVDALETWLSAGRVRYLTLHKVLGEGNHVLTISEGTAAGADGEHCPAALYDLVRIEDGLIAEQWNVTEVIAPREAWANDNGKF